VGQLLGQLVLPRRVPAVIRSLLYMALRRPLRLVAPSDRLDEALEVENLVLRHQTRSCSVRGSVPSTACATVLRLPRRQGSFPANVGVRFWFDPRPSCVGTADSWPASGRSLAALPDAQHLMRRSRP
jgi:hypothetical protein